MKHVIKKLTALVLAALLVLSLGVSAWATEGIREQLQDIPGDESRKDRRPAK